MASRKVYLPRWTMWFGTVMVAGMWILVTYLSFFTENAEGVVVWGIITMVMAAVEVILVLMGRRVLPLYVIEDDSD